MGIFLSGSKACFFSLLDDGGVKLFFEGLKCCCCHDQFLPLHILKHRSPAAIRATGVTLVQLLDVAG